MNTVAWCGHEAFPSPAQRTSLLGHCRASATNLSQEPFIRTSLLPIRRAVRARRSCCRRSECIRSHGPPSTSAADSCAAGLSSPAHARAHVHLTPSSSPISLGMTLSRRKWSQRWSARKARISQAEPSSRRSQGRTQDGQMRAEYARAFEWFVCPPTRDAGPLVRALRYGCGTSQRSVQSNRFLDQLPHRSRIDRVSVPQF